MAMNLFAVAADQTYLEAIWKLNTSYLEAGHLFRKFNLSS